MSSAPPMALDAAHLAGAIAALNDAVQALAPTDLTAKRLPSALAEIGAARQESDNAAMQILDAAEALMGLATEMGSPPGDGVMTATDAILQACTMNDIVGQRLAKAATAITEARDRLVALSDAIGIQSELAVDTADDKPVRDQLTFGPALGQVDVNQSDVDRLFAT